MLYSYADWLAVDPAMLHGDDLFDSHSEENQLPSAPFVAIVSNDVCARVPRSFEELQRGGSSLASSIEEFNAIIMSSMTSDWSHHDDNGENEEWSVANDASFGDLHEWLGARYFATRVSSSVTYGWTPFHAGEFQFARS